MSSPDERPNVQRPPDWAVDQATDELDGVDDSAAVEERAWQLVHDAEQREEERHDEYDDPRSGWRSMTQPTEPVQDGAAGMDGFT